MGRYHPFLRDKATVLLTEAYENRARLASAYFNSKHYMRYSTAMRRRPVRPIYIKRRRLMDRDVEMAMPSGLITPMRTTRLRRRYGGRKTRNKKRAFSRANIGEPLGTSSVKTRIVQVGGQLTKRTFGQHDLTVIPEGTGESQRERQIINCRGFSISLTFKNESSQVADLLTLNVAVVAMKHSSAAAIPPENWFKAEDNADQRGTDFTPALTNEEFFNLPINTDLYTVLKHKRYHLRHQQGGIDRYWRRIKWYIRLKRQLVYEDATEGSCRNKVFVVYWCDRFQNPSGSAAGAPGVTTQGKFVTYFRDSK